MYLRNTLPLELIAYTTTWIVASLFFIMVAIAHVIECQVSNQNIATANYRFNSKTGNASQCPTEKHLHITLIFH